MGTCADERSLGSILAEGLAGIATSKTRDLYSELETRELTAEEEAIINERVALQRHLSQIYEQRERVRKVQAVADVLPSLTKQQIEALVERYPREDEAISAYAANPEILLELNPTTNDSPWSSASPEGEALVDMQGMPKWSMKRPRLPRLRKPATLLHCDKPSFEIEKSQFEEPSSSTSPSASGPSRQPPGSQPSMAEFSTINDEPSIEEALPTSFNGKEGEEAPIGCRQWRVDCVEKDRTQPTFSVSVSVCKGGEEGQKASHMEKDDTVQITASNSLVECKGDTSCTQENSAGAEQASVLPLLVGCTRRPQRKAAQGVANLIRAMRQPVEPDRPTSTKKKKGIRQAAKKCMRQAHPEKVDNDMSSEPLPDPNDAIPQKKPRLGRVKKCSTKAVDLLEVGQLQVQPGWFNKGYIFTDGFKSCTPFRSSRDTDQSCRHVCCIKGKGGKYWPLPTFVIEADDCKVPIVAKSATGAWSGILNRINAAIEARRRAGEKLPPPPGTAIPGPEFFGLTNPAIVERIESLDPHKKCTSYWQGKQERLAFVRAHGCAPVKRDTDAQRPAKSSRQRWHSDEDTSEEEESDIIYAEDDEPASDGDVPLSRWSAVDRAQRRRARNADAPEIACAEEGVPQLDGMLDPITLQRMSRPTVSPYGHVMGMATWAAVLSATGCCPFTQQPLQREQLTVLTPANFDRLRERLILS